MNPAWWIGILALVGGVLGYAMLKWTGWLDVTVGVVVGALIGALIYMRSRSDSRKSD